MTRRSITGFTASSLQLLALVAATSLHAGAAGPPKPITFDFTFADNAGSARAVGSITFDENLLPNPAEGDLVFALPDPAVLALQVTVSGAASGNGTFALSDLTSVVWSTNGATLDLISQLVGQATPGDAWGSNSGAGGNFNLIADAPGPRGVNYFTLCADGGGADCMTLTSMVVEPRPITFDFLFEDLAGSARALGAVTFDENLLPSFTNQDAFVSLPNPAVLALQVVVSGAVAGNGTFGLGDFTAITFFSNGVILDYGVQLVGQPTHDDPWGTSSGGRGGDFNLQGAAPQPAGEDYFTLCANGGGADCMTLTSMMVGPQTPITFDFGFEDLGGSGARADGVVTFRDALLPNPLACDDLVFELPNPAVTGLQVSVSGAASGNGTFVLNEFSRLAWCTNGATLDLNRQLVGQATPGDPWGTSSDNGSGGDFNLFGLAPTPNGENYFTLCADGGASSCMTLTSMQIGVEFLCDGNCNGDGTVTIDDLVFGVNILNGRVLPARCRALSPDGSAITADQVLAAVDNALRGCLR